VTDQERDARASGWGARAGQAPTSKGARHDQLDSHHFTVHSATSTVRAIFIAALCAFIVTAFLIDVQRGVSRPDVPAAEQSS
jgi:hypothetical protein